jgi:acyl-CoA thioester hydrolase
MFTTTTTIRVRFYETDKMGFMHHSNYARYYECARTEAIRELGYTYRDIEEDGTIMPVLKIESKFIKSLFYDDEVTIHTQIQQMPRMGIISFHHQFYNQHQELVHEGSITLAMINTATNKRENGPAKLMNMLKPHFEV